MLPSSIRVEDSFSMAWQDYTFEAVFSIAPHQFDRLLSGRTFEEHPKPPFGWRVPESRPMVKQAGLELHESWVWSYRPPRLQNGDGGSRCVVYANERRDQLYLVYQAD